MVKVFLSYAKPITKKQEKFKNKVIQHLEENGFTARTLGVTDYSLDAPLIKIRQIMDECNGLLSIAFGRYYIEKGTAKHDANLKTQTPSDISGSWITSPYCQIEPAMAFQIDMPILIFREEGVIADGILERGVVGSYMPEFNLLSIDNYFKSSEWNQLINEWKKLVLDYQKRKQFKSDVIIKHILKCSICEDKEISAKELCAAFKKSMNSEVSNFSRFANLIEADEAFKNRYEIKGCSMESDYENICQKFFGLQNLSKDHDKKNQGTVNQEDQIHERYNQAIDQLGSENMIVRLVAISKLETIADNSNEHYWKIMELLTAYVREKSSINDQKVMEQNEVSEDIKAILTVIAKRNQKNLEESRTLYLRNTFLRKANLEKAHLEGADLTDSILTEAYLKETHLEGAYLSNANFYHAILSGSDLKQTHIEGASFERAVLEEVDLSGVDASLGADFPGANLERSNLRKIKLWGADLSGANLKEVHLEEANLEDADLKKAKLQGTYLEMALLSRADFTGANFEGAHLEEADLKDANLKGARNLTVDQLSKVHTLYHAQLDPELEKELRAKGFDYLLDDMSRAWL